MVCSWELETGSGEVCAQGEALLVARNCARVWGPWRSGGECWTGVENGGSWASWCEERPHGGVWVKGAGMRVGLCWEHGERCTEKVVPFVHQELARAGKGLCVSCGVAECAAWLEERRSSGSRLCGLWRLNWVGDPGKLEGGVAGTVGEERVSGMYGKVGRSWSEYNSAAGVPNS